MDGDTMLSFFLLYLQFLPYAVASEGSFFIKLPYDNRTIQLTGTESQYNANYINYCLQLCLQSTTCVSLSYENSLNNCALYSQIFNSSDFGAARDDIVYYGKQDTGNWAPWSNYTTCSVSCGVGSRVRLRACENPEPVYGGRCPGPILQGMICFQPDCPDIVCARHIEYVYDSSTTSCIKVFTQKKNFDDANSACEQEGAHLFKMDSVERKEFAMTIVTAVSSLNSFLIGGRDYNDTDIYTWTDGSVVSWTTPPNDPAQNCIRLNTALSQMDETFCNVKAAFICEQTVWSEN
ncbi:hypothetical protein LOTGIDRAFT_156921 [Lottia gigantea]|uniref:C-type lectin domain-containing protein n=1 Tax=Lottia gigantea TaxID=225164 RepID=V4AG04_LOTGI|nr:hypothetical protein LOTGIDRAFT_156921 [Lottia gigantea]ESP02964.1 hypothetical protein LOTGIDRAFT_156921 [Lottia gigantea]